MVEPKLSNEVYDDIVEELIVDIPEEELRWSTVKLTEIVEKEYRLEASVFDIEGKHAREILEKSKWDIISICGENGLANAYHRPRFKRVWVEKSEYPIYQPSQITEIYPKPDSYISEITKTNIEALRVKKGQILLTCSGTIGNCTLVTKTLDNKIFSHDLIRITCNNEEDAGFVYAFLRTKIGQVLVNTNNYGAVISHIEPNHLEHVPIPAIPAIYKAEINKLILDSFNLRDESNIQLDEANDLLINELKLPPIEELGQTSYSEQNDGLRNFNVKLSDLDNRLEGSYHIPIINTIINKLGESAAEVTTIGDTRISDNVILPGRFKRVYVEEGQGTVFFGGKQIYELDPSTKKYLSVKFHKKAIENELGLKENMILITRSGTIGKINIVPKHWENWVINEHVIRVVPSSDEIAGYLFAFLSSDFGYELITRFTYGAVVDEIDANHVSNIKVPLLKNKEIQTHINELVLDANKKRYEAYILEQKAVKLVNKLIHTMQ